MCDRKVACLILVIGVCSPLLGKELAEPGAKKTLSARLDEILRDWEQHGAIKTIDARFTRIDSDLRWDEIRIYEGRFILKKPGRAFLNFDEVVDGKNANPREVNINERYVWDGKKIYQYLGRSKQVFVFPHRQGDQRLSPSPDSEGFFAFLFRLSEYLTDPLYGDRLPLLFEIHVADLKRFY